MMTLLYIRYKDHVLFRNSDSSLYHPAIRECVGWVEKEDEESICVLFDRTSKPLPNQKTKLLENGLILLKGNIIEMKKLE